MLEKSGVATNEQIEKICPNQKRRSAGAFAAIECFQNIPCNPCRSSCPKGAIVMEDINDLPAVDFDKCNGCGICVSNCPGLAIFIVDESYSDTAAIIKLPYEFLPLPVKGDKVTAVDREGNKVCRAVVLNVVNTKMQERTPVVWLIVPKEFSMKVRFFIPEDEQVSEKAGKCGGKCDCTPVEKVTEEISGDTYICRCEEITVSKIREYIAKGYTTLDEIKRVSRAGMGACQGRTCRQLIMKEIGAATGITPEEMPVTTFRPPVKPIKMALLTKEDGGSDNE